MKYYERGGWWFPDEEVDLIEYMERGKAKRRGRYAYQCSKYERVQQYIRGDACAIDIGAHVGLWTYYLAFDFSKVLAFEPSLLHRECWEKNVQQPNAVLYPYALGNENSSRRLFVPDKGATGNTMIATNNDEGTPVEMRTLDSFNLEKLPVNFIKIDCEGFELQVLQGAEKSLLIWKPTIVVEQRSDFDLTTQFGNTRTGAVDYLKSLGAVLKEDLDQDFVLSWDK